MNIISWPNRLKCVPPLKPWPASRQIAHSSCEENQRTWVCCMRLKEMYLTNYFDSCCHCDQPTTFKNTLHNTIQLHIFPILYDHHSIFHTEHQRDKNMLKPQPSVNGSIKTHTSKAPGTKRSHHSCRSEWEPQSPAIGIQPFTLSKTNSLTMLYSTSYLHFRYPLWVIMKWFY